jgi:hypothetical protein
LCCVVAFAGYLPCLNYLDIKKDDKTKSYKYFFPGWGGALSITSFVFFMVVFIANIMISTDIPAADKEEDTKEVAEVPAAKPAGMIAPPPPPVDESAA